jgi:hypothetical protein
MSRHGAPPGFVLPIIVLALVLGGVAALSALAGSVIGARAAAAEVDRRRAFDAAEDALAAAVRSAGQRAAPWRSSWRTPDGITVDLQVSALGTWPADPLATPLLDDGTADSRVERHERAEALARTASGAAARLQQDYAVPGSADITETGAAP